VTENLYGLSLHEFIEKALSEDAGDGDHTSLATIATDDQSRAVVKVKEAGVIAGLAIAVEVLHAVDPSIEVKLQAHDGKAVKPGDEVMQLKGRTRSLLRAERLLLNFMQRMSGIATRTHELVKLIEGTSARLLDTRKTTPNFRMFEKQAVVMGGGINHRFGLYDMILIKDNHVDACGGIGKSIQRANEYLEQINKKLKIEIETRNLDEVSQVLRHGMVDRIMLDNFSLNDLQQAVQIISHRFETEASGGITDENIRAIADTGVDFISVGALTHSYKSLDINMKIVS